MFFAGFMTAAALAAILFILIAVGIHVCVKDDEMALAIYSTKEGKWKITNNFGKVAGRIEFRLKYDPDSIKILGEDKEK